MDIPPDSVRRLVVPGGDSWYRAADADPLANAAGIKITKTWLRTYIAVRPRPFRKGDRVRMRLCPGHPYSIFNGAEGILQFEYEPNHRGEVAWEILLTPPIPHKDGKGSITRTVAYPNVMRLLKGNAL